MTGILTGVRVNTDDGDFHLRAEAGSGMREDWSIHTDDGDVDLALPDDFAADLILHTDDGVTRVEQPVSMQGRMSGHRLSGQLSECDPNLVNSFLMS